MSKQIEALEMALEWIKKQPEETPDSKYDVDTRYVVIREIEASLAQPEQEPVLVECGNCHEGLADMEHVCKKCLGAGWVNNPQLKEPEQEPVAWATKDDFYRELEREFKRIREEMKIKSVTMRCKDYDIALPIIGTDFGRVLVGQVSIPPQRTWVGLTDEEIKQGESKEELGHGFIQGALWAEAALKEKNT